MLSLLHRRAYNIYLPFEIVAIWQCQFSVRHVRLTAMGEK
jgi:hypothetical protein